MRILKVSDNKRYLMWEDREPFFYMGDTAWELFHKLNRSEIEYYLDVRAEQGFNVIQAVALAELDGLRQPNAYGKNPLVYENGTYNPEKPLEEEDDDDYWKLVDFAINAAADRNMFIGLLPTWGDKYNLKWGKGPEIFDKDNAYVFGKWIANRYKNSWNVIWILGGDRALEQPEHYDVIESLAQGIKEVDHNHLVTFHPCGTKSSVDYVKGKDYIDFHMVQSGHGVESYNSYLLLRRTNEEEKKPFMDSEPRYEDHPACFNPQLGVLWSAEDIRNNAYWNLMEGVCGHIYGNHATWSFNTVIENYWPFKWQDVLKHPGAEQMKYLYQLRMSRDYFSFRPAPELVEQEITSTNYQSAGRGDKYAYIYTPMGLPITVNLNLLGAYIIKANWYNPRTGEITVYKILPANKCVCKPNIDQEGNDWVLILEFDL